MLTPRRAALWMMCVGLIGGAAAYAQNQTDQPDEQVDQSAEAESADRQPAKPASLPKPTEEVMHPTDYGLRLTPELARALSHSIVANITHDNPVSPEQRSRLIEALGKRILQTARENEQQAQAAIEYTFETGMASEIKHEKLTAESAREFSERLKPLVPALRELEEGVSNDFESILTPEQFKEFHSKLDKSKKDLDEFEARMDRWSKGEYNEGEQPFSSPADNAQQGGSQDKKITSPEMQGAEQRADNILRNLAPSTWEYFVNSTCEYFKLDEKQAARARKILADYKAKADAIMTPEWKRKIRENRLKQFFRYQLPSGVVFAPWNWRLEYDFNEAVKPLNELGRAFRKEVLAIATPEQRDTALTEIRKKAMEQGLTAEDVDTVLQTLEQN